MELKDLFFNSDTKYCAVVASTVGKRCDPKAKHCLGGFICTKNSPFYFGRKGKKGFGKWLPKKGGRFPQAIGGGGGAIGSGGGARTVFPQVDLRTSSSLPW